VVLDEELGPLVRRLRSVIQARHTESPARVQKSGTQVKNVNNDFQFWFSNLHTFEWHFVGGGPKKDLVRLKDGVGGSGS
jgi:hypothetical protein